MSDIKDIDEVYLAFGKYRGMMPCDVSIIDPHYQILKAIRGVLELNSKVMEEFKTGKKNPDSVKNFLLVQTMMALDGKANPALVRQLIVLQDSKNNW